MSQKWITVKDAANMIGVHDRTIRRYISEGKLKAKKENNRVLIDIDTINDLDHTQDHRQAIGSDQDIAYDQIIKQEKEIEFLRDRVKELEKQLSDARQASEEASHRHDTVVLQMTRLLEYEQLPFWRKLFSRKALPAPDQIMDMEPGEQEKE